VSIEKRTHSSEQQAVFDWITQADYAIQQSDFLRERQGGTGQWLIQSKKFQSWLESSQQTIFCPGMPGAGKTMITSIVVKYLHESFHDEPKVGVAYIYCNFQRGQEQTPEDLLASLLKQLIQERNDIPQAVMELHELHKKKRTRPSFDELLRTLRTVLGDNSRNFILVDALDECQVTNNGRERFLSTIFGLQSTTGANIFATSRHIPDIAKRFEGSIKVEIRATDEDVREYVRSRSSELPECVQSTTGLRTEVEDGIAVAVEGM